MYEQEKWELRAAAAARRGLSAESVDLVMFPGYSGRTVAARVGRTARLRDHLRRQLAATQDLPPRNETASAAEDLDIPPEPFRLESACATCRGYCCRHGADHAYVTPWTLQRVLATDPAADGGALIEDYLSHVPKRSYAGSCIYHSASGCALPRALRSDTCTRYLCSSLRRASEGASENRERAVIGVFEPALASPRVIVVHDSEVGELRPRRWAETR